MYVYIDETGNTGLRIIDPDQPIFVAVAVVSPEDFDSKFTDRLYRICNGRELHAQEWGPSEIEKVAAPLKALLVDADIRVVVQQIEKRSYAAWALARVLFDPYLNQWVPYSLLGSRQSKKLVAAELGRCIPSEVLELIWSSFTERGIDRAAPLRLAISRMPEWISRGMAGTALRRILLHGIQGLRQNFDTHSEYLGNSLIRKSLSPNIYAFQHMLSHVCRRAKECGAEVKEIKHDPQQQFGQELRFAHKAIGIEGSGRLFGPYDLIDPSATRNSIFSLHRSNKQSAGVNIADVIGWLYLRKIHGKPIGVNSTDLLFHVTNTASVDRIDAEFLVAEQSSSLSILRDTSLSKDELDEFLNRYRPELYTQFKLKDAMTNELRDLFQRRRMSSDEKVERLIAIYKNLDYGAGIDWSQVENMSWRTALTNM